MDDVLREFLIESNENLVRLEHEILELERAPTDAELLNSIFRTVHTIKGTCGFFELRRLERVAHASEGILALVREGRLDVSRPVLTSVLDAADVIRNILASLEHHGSEPSGDDDALIARLEACATNPQRSEPVHPPDSRVAVGATGTTQPAAPGPGGTVRVSTSLIDRLDYLAADLIHVTEELRHLVDATRDSAAARVERTNRIAVELEDITRRARMQPIGEIWTRLPRVVRDLAQETGKRIELDILGAETEVDRQVLQALQDPFMHIVRNCADHGIESPEARRRAGKPEHGRITLAAKHADGAVVIEVADDGAGLDVPKIRRRAIEHRLVSREVAAALNEEETLRLIFQPGFSTADRVTNVSGRGVGMDVVQTNISRIGGTVELSTRPGVGTTIRVKIPSRPVGSVRTG